MTIQPIAAFVDTPVRKTFLPFNQPDIEQAEIDEVVDTLRSGWITTGPRTKEFERRFAEYVGARHAIAVNSCTGGCTWPFIPPRSDRCWPYGRA